LLYGIHTITWRMPPFVGPFLGNRRVRTVASVGPRPRRDGASQPICSLRHQFGAVRQWSVASTRSQACSPVRTMADPSAMRPASSSARPAPAASRSTRITWPKFFLGVHATSPRLRILRITKAISERSRRATATMRQASRGEPRNLFRNPGHASAVGKSPPCSRQFSCPASHRPCHRTSSVAAGFAHRQPGRHQKNRKPNRAPT